jgi:hypothetical protein
VVMREGEYLARLARKHRADNDPSPNVSIVRETLWTTTLEALRRLGG